MKICWLVRVPISERAGQPYSPLAGVRMRVLMPMIELQRAGLDANITQLPDSGVPDANALRMLESSDAAFFGPVLPAPSQSIDDSAPAVFKLLEHLQQRGIQTLADIHDDHFEVPGRIEYFTGLVEKVDAVFVNSAAMAELVAKYTRRPLHIVGDPYEGPRGDAQFDPAAGQSWTDRIMPWRAPRLQLAWFGHQSNLQPVYDLAQKIADARIAWPVDLTLVSRDGFGAREFGEVFNHHHGGRCRLKFVEWSLDETRRVLDECDCAVVPADSRLRKTAVKSPNRIVEVLRAGRLPIAFPIPSYAEFARYGWIGEDVVAGIVWAMQHRDAALSRIKAGQAYVEQNFSAGSIGVQWRTALESLVHHAITR
ncbi:MAG TPA: hypothetical protein VGO84_08420 [Burkholderiales bacterium]|nr:hypothetical protein [Burkholderiales bacterium]